MVETSLSVTWVIFRLFAFYIFLYLIVTNKDLQHIVPESLKEVSSIGLKIFGVLISLSLFGTGWIILMNCLEGVTLL